VSGSIANNSIPAVKLYYQYVAQNIVTIRKKNIPTNETAALANFADATIDPHSINNLIVY
jgi:hypothetical protein